ncbi:hypothetical protein JRO89_XS01G0384300 [Xanthoceras sorbifolium]|uniref:U6 snRNA phosphodiesterase n=1 Tax=Xanthoceras sorbifolium TaxID=99658 RepID=A0ABQ8IPT4_9ROSI|nr:hypothetical protein JRO89_XS01G0384300 [Xanthoceras sorbifolium]
MEALRASYRDTSSDSDSDSERVNSKKARINTSDSNLATETTHLPLPPPPLSLINPPNSLGKLPKQLLVYAQVFVSAYQLFVDFPMKGMVDCLSSGQPSRVRSFPHVEGNYAVHVYIPVFIPSAPKKEMTQFLKKVSAVAPGLHVVDVDVPLNSLYKDDSKLQQLALGREFHISLGRTVPIRVHQIDSIVPMLRQKLQSQRRYWIDFSRWEVFVNDDCTRTFLSIEVITGGLLEITKQIQVVNDVYKLHNLPEFYKDARPHISLAWALGDISNSLKRVVEEEIKRLSVEGTLQKRIFSVKFSGIQCKIGNKTYNICKFSDE